MIYNYQIQRARIFTEEGQIMFLKIRDMAKKLSKQSGAVMCDKLLCVTGDTWDMLACVDRLVELKELIEIPNPTSSAGQHRVFIAPYEPL
jgi:hypothetical protein